MSTMTRSVLEVRDLSVGFPAMTGALLAVDRVSFSLERGRTLGLVGESGCGKSMTLRSLIGLVQRPGQVLAGEALLEGKDLLRLRRRDLAATRGSKLAMVFQDPMTSLNPVLTVGDQLVEVLRVKCGMSRRAAEARAAELLTRVGISSAKQRLRDYPHQLSGGMRQRVAIGLAVAADPIVLLADEPTTALDVTIQDQILLLLRELQDENGMAVVLVSHDLGVIGQSCDDVAVMYAGRIVEYGSIDNVLDNPRHPYTRALMASAPEVDVAAVRGQLATIGGQPPDLANLPAGCSFAPRCSHAAEECALAPMELDERPPSHGTACVRPWAVNA